MLPSWSLKSTVAPAFTRAGMAVGRSRRTAYISAGHTDRQTNSIVVNACLAMFNNRTMKRNQKQCQQRAKGFVLILEKNLNSNCMIYTVCEKKGSINSAASFHPRHFSSDDAVLSYKPLGVDNLI